MKKIVHTFISIIEKIFCFFINSLGKRTIILFESYSELGGSPWMIYQEMIKRGYKKKYKLIWAVGDDLVKPPCVNWCSFFGKTSLKSKIKSRIYLCSAKLIVENNRFLYKINPRTFRLHAQHGAPLKKCFSYTFLIGKPDAILSLSESTMELEQLIFPSAKNNLYALGYPSNDLLFESVDLYKIGFWECVTGELKRYKKIIGWLPTFRQHRFGSKRDSHLIFPFGVPLLKTLNDFEKLNACLQKKDVLLAIQMHHAQAKNFPTQNGFSNIVVIDPSVKKQFDVQNANLIHSFDALVTDYSGAYHEYLLLDRPIALSIDDYEEYAKNPGFSLDYFDWIKGVYLKDVSDLIKFIEEVSNGIDSAKTEREKAMHRIHKYIDNCSTQRVVDFLVEKAKL